MIVYQPRTGTILVPVTKIPFYPFTSLNIATCNYQLINCYMSEKFKYIHSFPFTCFSEIFLQTYAKLPNFQEILEYSSLVQIYYILLKISHCCLLFGSHRFSAILCINILHGKIPFLCDSVVST